MTVASELNKHIYDGDGVTTEWPITFPFTDADHIKVYITDAAGVLTLLEGGYTVDVEDSHVVYPASGSPLADDGSKITILREVPLTQLVDYKEQGAVSLEVLETALDQLTMGLQQLKESVGRAVLAPADSAGGEIGGVGDLLETLTEQLLAFYSGLEADGVGSGWFPVSDVEVWEGLSANTFRVSGNKLGKYSVGTKIRVTNNFAVKYFYIVAGSFDGSWTTYTVHGGTGTQFIGYVSGGIVGSGISVKSYSHANRPVGFPLWHQYEATFGGVTAATSLMLFRMDGRRVTFRSPGLLTSDDDVFTFSLPINRSSAGDWVGHLGVVLDGGAAALAYIAQDNGDESIAKVLLSDGSSWATSGAKGFLYPTEASYDA